MLVKEIKNGSRSVIISATDMTGPFTSSLYVNNGETICYSKKAWTLKGAEKQAAKMLAEACN